MVARGVGRVRQSRTVVIATGAYDKPNLLGVPGDAGLQEITFHDAAIEPAAKFSNKTGGWVGITDKYWASAIIPHQKVAYNATLEGEQPKAAGQLPMFLAEYEAEPTVVAAGSVASVKTQLYAGAKQASIIEKYGEKF